jgi:hypothetical protein
MVSPETAERTTAVNDESVHFGPPTRVQRRFAQPCSLNCCLLKLSLREANRRNLVPAFKEYRRVALRSEYPILAAHCTSHANYRLPRSDTGGRADSTRCRYHGGCPTCDPRLCLRSGGRRQSQAAFGGRYARIDPGLPIEAGARDRVRDGSVCHLLLARGTTSVAVTTRLLRSARNDTLTFALESRFSDRRH